MTSPAAADLVRSRLEFIHFEVHFWIPSAMKIAALKQRLAKKRAHFHAGGVGRRPMLHSLTNNGRGYPKMDLKMYKLQGRASSLSKRLCIQPTQTVSRQSAVA